MGGSIWLRYFNALAQNKQFLKRTKGSLLYKKTKQKMTTATQSDGAGKTKEIFIFFIIFFFFRILSFNQEKMLNFF